MKRIAVILILCFSIARAQDASTPLVKNKLSLTYGIIFIQPDEINNHITGSNDALGSSTKIIESLPEASVLFSIRPREDSQIITARVGHMYITRIYDVSIPETTTSSTSAPERRSKSFLVPICPIETSDQPTAPTWFVASSIPLPTTAGPCSLAGEPSFSSILAIPCASGWWLRSTFAPES